MAVKVKSNKSKVMSKNSQVKHDTPNDVEYLHFSPQIQDLEGQILTFIDASISDPVQRKALKDLFRPMIWRWAIDSNMASNYEIKMKSSVREEISKAL